MSRNCWGTLAFLLGSVTYWQWFKPYELMWMYFNIARVSLGLAVILMSWSLNFPRNYYYFLQVNVPFFQRSVWFLTFSKALQLPNSCHFTPRGTKNSRLLKFELGNQAQLVWSGSASSHLAVTSGHIYAAGYMPAMEICFQAERCLSF